MTPNTHTEITTPETTVCELAEGESVTVTHAGSINITTSGQEYAIYNGIGNTSGSIINNGSLSAEYPIRNSGTVNGSIINSGTMTAGGYPIGNTGTITGNIENYGELNGQIYGIFNGESGTILGGIINTGQIIALSASGTGIYNEGNIGGNITNTGTVKGTFYGLENLAELTGNVVNDGLISGGYGGITNVIAIADIDNSGTIEATSSYQEWYDSHGIYNAAILNFNKITSIINTGTLSGTTGISNATAPQFARSIVEDGNIGSIVNEKPGIISGVNYGIHNTAGATIGLIDNSGTIAGGTFAIINEGFITSGIVNSGTLNGAVQLGDASLTLTGNSAAVTGAITGSDASSITVQGEFATDADAAVGTLDVDAGATLTVRDGTLWTTASGTGISGTLQVDTGATLGGSVTVANGGTLSSFGVIGSDDESLLTINAGGTLSSGVSIGKPTIKGDLVFNAGSTYAVDIAGNGTSDLTHVTGTTTINGGAVSISALDQKTSYQNGQTYKILTSDGGVTGTFTQDVSRSAFLDVKTSYDPANVYLDITVKDEGPEPAVFERVAETKNEISTAIALDTLAQSGDSLSLYNTLLILNADEARAAFDRLSGEIHASAKTALIAGSHFTRNAVNERLLQAFGDRYASPTLITAYGPQPAKTATPFDTATPAASAAPLYGAWAQAFGGWGEVDADGNAGELSYSTGGFVTGVDTLVYDNWRLGVVAGYSRTTFDSDERFSSGESDNYTLGAYAGSHWGFGHGDLALRSGMTYTWHRIETSRSAAFPGFADSLDADYDAGTWQVFGELGYRVETGSATFEPFANLAYVRLRTDGYDESGSSAAALSAGSDTTGTTFTTLGLRAASALNLGQVNSRLQGTIGWRHAYGDITPVSTHSFIGSDAFTVSGLPIGEDTAIVEAGIEFDLSPTSTLGAFYQGQYGSGTEENGFNVKLNISF